MQFTDRQEKWSYILTNINHMEPQDLSQEDEVFRSVFEDSMHQKLTNMEKEEYKKSVLEYKDVQAAVQYAREQGEKLGYDSGFGSGYDSGVEHGIKQGIEQGIKQGIEQGIEQGRMEGLKEGLRQLINGLLANGFDLATIVKATGMEEDEIRNIISE